MKGAKADNFVTPPGVGGFAASSPLGPREKSDDRQKAVRVAIPTWGPRRPQYRYLP